MITRCLNIFQGFLDALMVLLLEVSVLLFVVLMEWIGRNQTCFLFTNE